VKDITAALAKKDKLERLHTWLDYLEKNVKIIWVQVADQRTAYTISKR